MTRSAAHQRKIDHINDLVDRYKNQDNRLALDELIEIFDPFLTKQCNKWGEIYKGTFNHKDAKQEARLIFYQLVDEYTIGGPAYFNVFLIRKLPLRLRYQFIKEIKIRQRNLCHSEEQFLQDGLIGDYEIEDKYLDAMEDRKRVEAIVEVIKTSDVLNDRERDMIISNIYNEESHQSIATRYGISRSRVSRVISMALDKIRGEVKWTWKQ